eukprot:6453265-Prymnesium_polylepis.1
MELTCYRSVRLQPSSHAPHRAVTTSRKAGRNSQRHLGQKAKGPRLLFPLPLALHEAQRQLQSKLQSSPRTAIRAAHRTGSRPLYSGSLRPISPHPPKPPK